MQHTTCIKNDNGSDVLAHRVTNIPRSFLREILKVAISPGMISFAGGLPNKELFPVAALQEACNKVFEICGPDILQYSSSEGLDELREYISNWYKIKGVKNVKPENILITCGSQQALDLIAKILINQGDLVALEEPSYLGAIQALSIYEPTFVTIPLLQDGIDTECLGAELKKNIKLLYTIPNFQNPSGISYSDENRKAVANLLRGTRTYIVEDDPYGELRFSGQSKISFMNLVPENTILLGTFSKTVVPAFRLGWAVVPSCLMEKMVVAKQAADLHTNSYAQRALYQYLIDNDQTAHIAKIVKTYSIQKDAMMDAMKIYFPDTVKYTNPEGGMFMWITLPDNKSAMTLFEMAVKDGVCIVPGHPFYIGKEQVSTARLSFSCVDVEMIDKGIKKLGHSIEQLLNKNHSTE